MSIHDQLDPREEEYRKELAGRAEAGLLRVLDQHPAEKNWLLHGGKEGPQVRITHGLHAGQEGQTYITRQIDALARTPEQKAAGGSTAIRLGNVRSALLEEAELGSDPGSVSRPRFQDTLDAYNQLVKNDPEALRALELQEIDRQLAENAIRETQAKVEGGKRYLKHIREELARVQALLSEK